MPKTWQQLTFDERKQANQQLEASGIAVYDPTTTPAANSNRTIGEVIQDIAQQVTVNETAKSHLIEQIHRVCVLSYTRGFGSGMAAENERIRKRQEQADA